MVDPFDGLDSRKAAALRICVEKRQAALTAHRAYEAKAEQALEALRMAKREGLGIRRLAHAWKVSDQYIWKVTRKEKERELPTRTPLGRPMSPLPGTPAAAIEKEEDATANPSSDYKEGTLRLD